MAFPTEVSISVNKVPKFPKRCLVCCEKNPDTRMRVGDFLVGWFSFFTDIPEGWGDVVVPVHAGCKRPFRLRRWLTRLGCIAFGSLMLYAFHDQIEAVLPGRFGRKIFLFIALIPLAVLELMNPPQFDVTFTKYYVIFQFANPRFAAAFAKHNDEMRRYREIQAELGDFVDP